MRWRWLIGLAVYVALFFACGPPAAPTSSAAEEGGSRPGPSGSASASAAADEKQADQKVADPKEADDDKIVPIEKSLAEWRRQLSSKQFRVTRQGMTEEAFTGRYVHTKRPGTYCCVCCDLDLFGSQTKFDSQTGWPSYWAPLKNNRVKLSIDTSDPLEVKTEVRAPAATPTWATFLPTAPRPPASAIA